MKKDKAWWSELSLRWKWYFFWYHFWNTEGEWEIGRWKILIFLQRELVLGIGYKDGRVAMYRDNSWKLEKSGSQHIFTIELPFIYIDIRGPYYANLL
jgi:hypothetical protein